MKKKYTSRLAAIMCLVLLISSFAACSIKEGGLDSTVPTVNPNQDSWYANGVYEPVTITDVELVQLVNDALGSEAAGWDGNLGSLTNEQLEKVEQAAQNQGLIVEKDESGNTVIKKEEIPTTQATPEEVTNIMNKVSVQDMSNVSPSQYVEISKVAASNNMAAVTKPGSSEVVIVKPVPTSQAPVNPNNPSNPVNPNNPSNPVNPNNPTQSQKPTQAPTQAPTFKPNQTEKPAVQGTTSVYVPPTNKPVPTIAPTKAPMPTFSNAWVSTYGDTRNDIFYSSEIFEKGVVTVGVTYPKDGSKTSAHIIAYNDKNKKLWEDVITGDNVTTFEDVTVLSDGSIVAVGYTRSKVNLEGFTDADFKCKGTIEGIAVKYNKNGDIVWRKVYGGSAGDMIYAVTATPDGGFVLGGKSESTDADLKGLGTLKIKAFMLKCDTNGNVQWGQALSGSKHSAVEDLTSNSAGEIYATIDARTGDGEYASIEGAQTAKRTTVVAKLNPNGAIAWSRCFWDTGRTELYSIETTSDGGCIIAGQYTAAAGGTEGSFKDFHNGGNFDCMIIKMNPNGVVNWMTPIIGFESDFASSIVKIRGGYAVTGYTTSSNRDFPISNKGDNDIFIYTIDEYGAKKNIYSLGGSASDNACGICSDGNDSVYICGSTNSGDGYFAECSAKGNENVAVGFISRFALSAQ